VAEALSWQQKVGRQRNWSWRGWQIRYTYSRPVEAVQRHPPLLLLHGFGASIGHWRHTIPELSQHSTVYGLDLLGFGASEKTLTNYRVPLWAEQVHDFWQTFIREPVILMGNSLGSLVCLAIAGTYPEMVAGVVMLNLPDRSVLQDVVPGWLEKAVLQPLGIIIQPVRFLLTSILTSPPIFNPLFRLIRQPAVIRFWAKQAYANAHVVDDDLVEILCRPAHERRAARALVAMTQSPKEFPISKTILPSLNIPMLLVWGQQDRFVPPFLGSLFTQYNPKLQLVALENAGHCPHDECPETVNRLILDWIKTWY
jgi:pimeloyl-ACP methyl ester carboxylesterase